MCECGGSEYDDTCICIPSVTGWVNLSSTSGATLTKSFRESSLNPLICTIEKLAHRDSGRATGESAYERLAHSKCSETLAVIVMIKMRFQRMDLKSSMRESVP